MPYFYSFILFLKRKSQLDNILHFTLSPHFIKRLNVDFYCSTSLFLLQKLPLTSLSTGLLSVTSETQSHVSALTVFKRTDRRRLRVTCPSWLLSGRQRSLLWLLSGPLHAHFCLDSDLWNLSVTSLLSLLSGRHRLTPRARG